MVCTVSGFVVSNFSALFLVPRMLHHYQSSCAPNQMHVNILFLVAFVQNGVVGVWRVDNRGKILPVVTFKKPAAVTHIAFAGSITAAVDR